MGYLSTAVSSGCAWQVNLGGVPASGTIVQMAVQLVNSTSVTGTPGGSTLLQLSDGTSGNVITTVGPLVAGSVLTVNATKASFRVSILSVAARDGVEPVVTGGLVVFFQSRAVGELMSQSLLSVPSFASNVTTTPVVDTASAFIGIIVGVTVGVLVVLAIVAAVIYRKCWNRIETRFADVRYHRATHGIELDEVMYDEQDGADGASGGLPESGGVGGGIGVPAGSSRALLDATAPPGVRTSSAGVAPTAATAARGAVGGARASGRPHRDSSPPSASDDGSPTRLSAVGRWQRRTSAFSSGEADQYDGLSSVEQSASEASDSGSRGSAAPMASAAQRSARVSFARSVELPNIRRR